MPLMRSIVLGCSVNAACADAHDLSGGTPSRFQKRIRRVAVIGGGPMAFGWAAYYFMRGFDVVAADPMRATADNLLQSVDSLLRTVSDPGQREAARGSLKLASDPDEALLRADFIQECTDGTPNSKVELLAEIDKCTRPDSIIATDASFSIMKAVQSSFHFGDRCIISRCPDLPHLNPFTFIVNCTGTSPLAVRQAMQIYARAGRLPIYFRGEVEAGEEFTDGLLAMFHREAVHLRELGIVGELDLSNFASWAPSLCCSALVSAMQPRKLSDRATLHSNEVAVGVSFEHPETASRSLDDRISADRISPSPACVA